MHVIQDIIQANKAGNPVGVYSCCSASEDVIRAVLLHAREANTIALIESTSNQVNQMGGYTGMTPASFADYVYRLADEIGCPSKNIILGGDHLGPLPWAGLPEEEAMACAEELACACVQAGYEKIHLDTSMKLASDNPNEPLPAETCATRAARLCVACEHAFDAYRTKHPDAQPLIYTIGNEVPVPGGNANAEEAGITSTTDALNTIAVTKKAFEDAGVGDAFERLVGLVVALGIEFHEFSLEEYDRFKTADLVKAIRDTPLCIEGHSTDFQTSENLRLLCEDGVAILKVGPALTFAVREALFALEHIERELYRETPRTLSNYRAVLERVMLENPSFWKPYYGGAESEQRLARAYSYYDRSRYYLSHPEVVQARATLLDNLSGDVIPLGLLSQYLPCQYRHVSQGFIRNEALDILIDHIGDSIKCYMEATGNCGRDLATDATRLQKAKKD